MGAEQSSNRDRPQGQGQDASVAKTCYYELLQIERHATDDEIKKAYRRKALELHPDRNYGNAEESTKLFAEIQSAYQVLSDPHERAWYDSHREAILRNYDVDSSGDQYAHNVKLTSALDIISLMGKFSSSVPFTDAPDGFYGRLRSLFATIADEEITACEWENIQIIEYPDFGSANDSYEDVVKPFYAAWAGFSTKKSFSWCDMHNYADAPDRRIRRLMEKENKRLRDEGTRQFNDAVRNLVSFVRRRDPRYIPNTQTEADRQKILRDAAAAQAARSRAAYQAKFDEHVVPAWAQTQDQNQEEEGKFSDSEESEIEEIECVICNKLFKSEKQYEAHEKSKKHIKAIQQLKRQMQKENKKFNLDGDQTPNSGVEFTPMEEEETIDEEAQASEDSESEEPAVEDLSNQDVDPEVENPVPTPTSSTLDPSSMNAPESPETEQELDDEYAPREEVETRFSKLGISTPDQPPLDSDGEQDSSSKEPSQKLGKAKAKRAKKVARQEASDKSQFSCATCNETFSSKTKLFNHIKEEDHAQPIQKASRESKKKNRI